MQCVQISVDGANAATHARMRPGGSHGAALGAIERLVARGVKPSWSSSRRASTCGNRRGLRPCAVSRVRGFRHRPAHAPGTRRPDWQNLAPSESSGRKPWCGYANAPRKPVPAWRSRSIPGTSSRSCARAWRVRRRCCSWFRTAR
jgi:hypothetical protein